MYTNFSPYNYTGKCILLFTGFILSVVLVFASSGGGGNGKKSSKSSIETLSLTVHTKVIAPFRATNMNFSQKNSKDLKFVGNLKMFQSTTVIMNSSNQSTVISQSSILKYKVGNTIYLVPNKTSYNVTPKNNFNAIDVKIAF